MKTYKFYFIIAVISFLSSSCSDFILGEDERIDKTIEISDINKIQIESVFYIELVQDTAEYIIATGSQSQLKELKILGKDNTCSLEHNYTSLVKNYTPINLEIHLKDIKTITVKSPSNISNTETINIDGIDIYVTADTELVEMNLNLNCQKLSLDVRGGVSGKFEFKGECTKASYVINGTTNIEATDFKTQNTSIGQNSIGEVYLFAEQKITATIYSFGNIYYKGNPEIEIKRVQINNQSPTAELIPIN